ncbi:L,D-transpeptidase [Mucilaginibacter hurinus]|uniref:L,D-transpeptidase n=1 Tax=Mucilaginibacter hurinus TaxID=2201324 RepID=A0A367GS94_9SPHI|nr:L,D-transpeptidase family protein [Mucilaginibacter hurinus]RCH56307.1 L,D-transpeptidase [Mucilaginibacter hurinus]
MKDKLPKYLWLMLTGLVLVLIMPACKKSRSDMGKQLAKETKNKIFKQVTPEDFAPIFQKVLEDKKGTLANPKVISAFYAQNGFDPVLVMNHLKDEELKVLVEYYNKAPEHGIKPQIFQAPAINALVNKLYDKKAIKTLDEAYQTIAELELAAANSLINYSNAMQFGLISPRRIYARYYTETKRPDSAFMNNVFAVGSLRNYLDSIQPKDPQYLALQKAFKEDVKVKGLPPEESERYFAVNMERLRWKNKPTADKYVWVNIPDFTLDVMENGHSTLNMKVCVGEGRNMEGEVSLTEYDESDKVDRPFSRETPQLNSMIHSVQVNPVWNIPKSIATKEIMVAAAADPYYLGNENIDVYYKGQLVNDPETIDWSSASKDDYEFKQRPGDDNALGKIKFLFKNRSSVYLHDTPAKLAFNRTMRAVSHGCVRVEQPQKLAEALFGNGKKYQTIVEKMNGNNDSPTDIGLSPKVPVFITYMTCWVSKDGLQFRPDVYGLDVVLYAHMKKLVTV